MDFLDLTLPTAEENLALDEALLLEAEAGRGAEVLRTWEWPSLAVILGSGCKLAEDVDEVACRAAGVPILRRSRAAAGRCCWVPVACAIAWCSATTAIPCWPTFDPLIS